MTTVPVCVKLLSLCHVPPANARRGALLNQAEPATVTAKLASCGEKVMSRRPGVAVWEAFTVLAWAVPA